MNSVEIEKYFWNLCDEAKEFEKKNYDLPSLEPYLLKILMFIKSNPEHTNLFKDLFIKLAIDPKYDYPDYIIYYCMRELQYSEVRYAVNKRFEELGGAEKAPGMMSFVSDLYYVYIDEPWEDAVFFEYYRENKIKIYLKKIFSKKKKSNLYIKGVYMGYRWEAVRRQSKFKKLLSYLLGK